MTGAARLAVASLAAALLCCLYGQVIAPRPVAPGVVSCAPAISVDGRLHCGASALAGLLRLCEGAFTDADLASGDAVSLAGGCRIVGRIPGSELVALGVPIDLNRASAAELEGLPGIGPTLARRIVEARPLRRVDELSRIRGIGPVRLAQLRPLVSTTP